MQDEASIRQELELLTALLERRRRGLPGEYRRALQDSAWFLGRVQGLDPPLPPGRPRWVPVVAAAAMAAGLLSTPPGFALPVLPGDGGAAPGVEIPPPPVILPFNEGLMQEPAPPLAGQPPGASRESEAASDPAPALPGWASDGPAVPAPAEGAAARAPAPPEVRLPFAAPPEARLPFAAPREEAPRLQPEQTVRSPGPAEASRARQPAVPQGLARGRTRTTVAATRADPVRWYTIQPGDTLSKLARRWYDGTGARWKGIFAVNRSRLASPHVIFPGDRIAIPTLAEAIAAEQGHVPVVGSRDKRVADSQPRRRGASWRHKTRVANREPILLLRPGLPI